METVKRKPNWSEKETLMLARGERPRGSSLCKICGGWGQGDKIKRDRLGGGGLHDKQVCIECFGVKFVTIYPEMTS
jgi:hypothetical protein